LERQHRPNLELPLEKGGAREEVEKMKNRFVGIITVTFPDGYIEKCVIKERVEKGKENFLNLVKEYGLLILEHAPKGKVKLNYKGDFAKTIAEHLKEREK